MAYFLLRSGEDGTSITPMTKDELRELLESDEGRYKPISEIPPNDKGYWEADEDVVVIIKGEIVMPKPRRIVKSYDIP